MAPRRVIADSDDEDDDFSPVKEVPLASASYSEEEHVESAESLRQVVVDADSTDPSFFRDIYDEQRELARQAQDSCGAAIASPIYGRLSAADTHTSSLTDVTDPTAGRKRGRNHAREIVDLTQVTTPGRQRPGMVSSRDPYDLPSSPEPQVDLGLGPGFAGSSAQSRSAKTSLKRRRSMSLMKPAREGHAWAELGSGDPPAPDEEGSPLPARKRRRGLPVPSSRPDDDEMDIILVPKTATRSSGHEPPSLPKSGAVPDVIQATVGRPDLSICIQPALTTSQRQEYQTFNDNSSSMNNPLDTYGRTVDGISSGMTTNPFTVTPSVPRSSIPAVAGRSSPQRSGLQESMTAPPQFAEELDGVAENASSAAAQTSRTAAARAAPGDEWEADELALYQDLYQPRPSRRRQRKSTDEPALGNGQPEEGSAHDTAIPLDDDGGDYNEQQEELPKPKKRGRLKKDNTAVAEEGLAPPKSSDKRKKKRGQPKKGDVPSANPVTLRKKDDSPGDANGEVDDVYSQEAAADSGTNRETGREEQLTSDALSKTASPPPPDPELSSPQAAARRPKGKKNAERAPQLAAPDLAIQDKENVQPPDGTAAPKTRTRDKTGGDFQTATLSASQAKPPTYRVGLSKRFRIAPLLKMVKRP